MGLVDPDSLLTEFSKYSSQIKKAGGVIYAVTIEISTTEKVMKL